MTHKLLKYIKRWDLKLGFINTDNKSTISLDIDYYSLKVSRFHIDFEVGAYFRIKLRGIKYSVA
ncbi:MAG: hypothetical protein LBE34_08020 [Flavobacteriaceae bacterium]|nr:hypothetical protein [Flavobacteriaceae bacterium]